MDTTSKNLMKLLGAVAVLVAAVIGISVFVESQKNAHLSILVAPSNATITIDGQNYQNGIYNLFPKDALPVTISSDGYETYNGVINLKSNETTNLQVVLADQGGGYKSYLRNTEDYAQLKVVAAGLDNDEIQKMINETEKALTVRAVLPINYNSAPFYKDTHGFILSPDGGHTIQMMESSDDCGVIPCIEVYDTDQNLERAKKYLESLGYDTAPYRFHMNNRYLYEPKYDN